MRRMLSFHYPLNQTRMILGIVGWSIAFLTEPAFMGAPSILSAAVDQAPVVITITARQFLPPLVTLRAGQPATLVFENRDTELHSFVPKDLLRGVNLNVGGNGAPEFGEEGFKRVIIPPEGRVEIRFTPLRAGEFAYQCDMPGHQMRAQIVVEHEP